MSDVRTIVTAHQSITVDRSACIGSGNCGMWAAGTFALDDQDLVDLIEGSDDDETVIAEAAKRCPAQAIVVTPIP